MKLGWLCTLCTLCVLTSRAQTARKQDAADFPEYKISEGSLDADGLPTSGAKLCVIAPPPTCFRMPSNAGYSEGGIVYDYGLDPAAQRLKLASGGSFVLFSSTFSGGGSGTLESLAVLRYKSDGTIEDILPFVAVTNQGQTAAWSEPAISNYPILVTADADWEDKETHFARHFFEIRVYRYNPNTGLYERVLTYKTAKKYPSLDEVDRISVLGPEKITILQLLRTSPTH